MRRTSLDILEKSRLPVEQATAILEVMELELQNQREELATKADLSREVAQLRSDMRQMFFEMRTELTAGLHGLELQVQSQRAEMARWILGSSGALIGAFGVMLGLFYFFTSRLGR